MKRLNWSLEKTQLLAKTLMLSTALAALLFIFDVVNPFLSDATAQAAQRIAQVAPTKKAATPETAPAPQPHSLASQSNPSLASQSNQGKANSRTKR